MNRKILKVTIFLSFMVFTVCLQQSSFAINENKTNINKGMKIRSLNISDFDDALYLGNITTLSNAIQTEENTESKNLLDYFREQTENLSEFIEVSEYNIPITEADKVYELLVLSSPRSYYLLGENGECSYYYYASYNEDGEKIVSEIYPLYTVDVYDENYYIDENKVEALKPEIEETKRCFDEEVYNIRKGITPQMSNIDKLVYFHDYMIYNYSYSYEDSYKDFENRTHNTAAEIARDKKGMCLAFAMMYNYLAIEEGIETAFVTSYDDSGYDYHTWNLVKVKSGEAGSEEWYHVDVTWDATSTIGYGTYSNQYLLISDFLCRQSHETDGVTYPELKVETSKALDNVEWKNTKSRVIKVNDKIYFLRDGEVKDSVILYEYNPNDKSCTGVYEFNDRWCNYDNLYYGISFTGLGYLNGKFYYNTSDKIMELDLESKISTVIYESNRKKELIYSSYIDGTTLNYGILNKESNGGFIVYGGSIALSGVKLEYFSVDENVIGIKFETYKSAGNTDFDSQSILISVIENGNVKMKSINIKDSHTEEIQIEKNKTYKILIWDDKMKPLYKKKSL